MAVNDLYDTVFQILCSSYDSNNELTYNQASYSEFKPLTVPVTQRIVGRIALAYITAGNDSIDDDSLLRNVINECWNAWSGGGVAESTAKKILTALGVSYEDES